jgi:hypothetical protein
MKSLDKMYIVSLLDGKHFICRKWLIAFRIGTAYFGFGFGISA